MDDLISRQAAIDILYKNYILGRGDLNEVLDHIVDRLEKLPSAQSEIIRCRECKFYTEIRPDLNTGICNLACRHLDGDGFCSEAERKTDEV